MTETKYTSTALNDETIPEILIGRAYDGEVCDDAHRKIAKVYDVLIQPGGKEGTFVADGKIHSETIAKGRFLSSHEARLLRIESVRVCPTDGTRHFHFVVRSAPEKNLWETAIPTSQPIHASTQVRLPADRFNK